jgi:hypothetical protein
MSRSLMPREHGAYALLGAPLVAALLSANPRVASILFGGAAIAFFLTREPAMIALGLRGTKVRREEGWRARRRLGMLLTVGILLGGVAVFLATNRVRMSVGGPSVLAGLLGVMMVRGEDKTLGGELLAAAALPSVVFPLLMASDVPMPIAFQSWLTWVMGFGCTTVAVRAVTAPKEERAEVRRRSLAWLLGITVLGLVGLPFGATLGFIPALPLVISGWAIVMARPQPANLPKVGWALGGAALATGALLVWISRA